MPDIVSPSTRSRMMSGIGSRNTIPELAVRKGLHARGFRYCLHNKKLPGKPDLVFPKFKSVVFVNGCFWHGHDCHLFKWPLSRAEFWRQKIEGNKKRDRQTVEILEKLGWRVLTVWECAIKGRTRCDPTEMLDRIAEWLDNGIIQKNTEGRNGTC